ncbi:hypothetical protein [Jiangella anatolica]|uniref:hypothetical protein n=1 Tax=Jiangella anatolica TaxID=2670374 RepID=UPI0013144AC2|nr:hypothetical protein [Jiangella anatolica]
MRRNDILRTLVVRHGPVVDRTDGAVKFPADIAVAAVAEPANGAGPAAAVDLVAASDRADDLGRRLTGSGAGVVVLLLPWDAGTLPIGDLVQGVGAAGYQVTGMLPLDEADTPAALIAARVGDGEPVLHPYLGWDGDATPVDRPALLRLVNEHHVESFVWRILEQRLRELDDRARELETRNAEAEKAAAESAAERTAALDQLAGVEATLARTTAERDAVQGRMRRVETSSSYRLARRLAASKQALARLVGAGR